MSRLLPGTLKYSWYKYCKALHLIKALVFINEVTEGSIDQAFCFMSWRFSPLLLLSLSHIPTLCTALSLPLSLLPQMTLSLMHIFSGSHTSLLSQDICAALQVACLLVDDPLFCLSLTLFMFLSLLYIFSLCCFGSSTGLVLTAAQLAGLSERELALFDSVKWSTCWSKWGAQCSVTERTRRSGWGWVCCSGCL